MIEGGCGAPLPLEPPDAIWIAGERRREYLQRNIALEPHIVGAIHLAHASGADGREDFVGPESCAGRERHAQHSAKFSRSRSRIGSRSRRIRGLFRWAGFRLVTPRQWRLWKKNPHLGKWRHWPESRSGKLTSGLRPDYALLGKRARPSHRHGATDIVRYRCLVVGQFELTHYPPETSAMKPATKRW